MTRAPRPRCAGPTIPPRGDRDRVCLVCHQYIQEGRGVGLPHLRAMVCQAFCSDLVTSLGRIYDRSPRGHWRPVHVVRDLANGARCHACKVVSE
jgi:hypothetical protein